jgi:hypothetical protein
MHHGAGHPAGFGHDLDVRALLHAMTELDSLAAQWLAAAI